MTYVPAKDTADIPRPHYRCMYGNLVLRVESKGRDALAWLEGRDGRYYVEAVMPAGDDDISFEVARGLATATLAA